MTYGAFVILKQSESKDLKNKQKTNENKKQTNPKHSDSHTNNLLIFTKITRGAVLVTKTPVKDTQLHH